MFSRVRDWNNGRKVRKVQRRLEQSAPSPSELAKFAANVPRSVRRSHKLETRGLYRRPIFKGILDSHQRQILLEAVATSIFQEAENDRERHATEDEDYYVTSRAPA